MKNIRIMLVTAIMMLAGSIVTKAQTVDEIIQKHIAAIGGADNWKKINTMKVTGSVNAGGTEIPVTVVTVQGKAQRVDFTMNGMTGYQILTTKEGWNYNPFAGQTKAEASTAEDVKQSQDGLDLQGPLIDYKAKGNTVTYLGKDDVEGTECFKLKVVYPNGKDETMYIDASNYYHIRTVAKIKADGKEVEQTSNYGNYTKLPEGIVFPMSEESGNGPIAFKTVEINKTVDESIFKPSK